MTEEEWDAVIAVHLKGHFAPTPLGGRLLARAVQGRRRRSRATSCTRRRRRGCSPTPARPTTARRRPASPRSARSPPRSSSRYNVKSNTIAPGARTRLTLATPGPRGHHEAARTARSTSGIRPTSRRSSPTWPPPSASFTGETFLVQGGNVTLIESWARGEGVDRDSKWTVGELADALAPLARRPSEAGGASVRQRRTRTRTSTTTRPDAVVRLGRRRRARRHPVADPAAPPDRPQGRPRPALGGLWVVLGGLFTVSFTDHDPGRVAASASPTTSDSTGQRAHVGDHRADAGVRRGRTGVRQGRRPVGPQAGLRARPAARRRLRRADRGGVERAVDDRCSASCRPRRLGVRTVGDGVHQPHVRAGDARQAAGLLELRHRRRAGARRRRRWTAGRGGRLAGDLRRPGAAVPRRRRAWRCGCCPAPIACRACASTSRVRSRSASAPRRCSPGSTRARGGGGRAPASLACFALGVASLVLFVRVEQRARRSARAARLVPHAQRRVAGAQPDADQLRVHGRVHPRAAGAAGRVWSCPSRRPACS